MNRIYSHLIMDPLPKAIILEQTTDKACLRNCTIRSFFPMLGEPSPVPFGSIICYLWVDCYQILANSIA